MLEPLPFIPRRLVLAGVLLLLISACARGPARESDTAPDSTRISRTVRPDSTGVEFVALGNEPFWNVKVTADSIVWRTPDQIDGVLFPGVPVESIQGRLVWRTSRAGTPSKLELAITPQACSDGMSDRSYLFAAEVVLDTVTYRGCAEERVAGR